MLSQAVLDDINSFTEDDQNKVINLVYYIKQRKTSSASEWLDRQREKYADTNPMTMQEIDRIIHE